MELKEIYEKRFTMARWVLLLVALFSTVNLVWIIIDKSFAFVATAAIPEVLALIEIVLYTQQAPLFWQIVCIAVIVALLLLYTVCGLISKQRSGWLTAGSILYFFDCVVRVYLICMDLMGGRDDLGIILLRGLIPAVLLFFVIRGLIARSKLKKMA